MKFKTLIIVFFISLFFLGTQSSAFEPQDVFVITYEISAEISEQIEESEDNRNFLPSTPLLSYVTIDSCAIMYTPSFFLREKLIDIQKPPIIS